MCRALPVGSTSSHYLRLFTSLPKTRYFHVLIKGEMSMFNVISCQTGGARLCMPSAPFRLLSWSVNGLTLLPPPSSSLLFSLSSAVTLQDVRPTQNTYTCTHIEQREKKQHKKIFFFLLWARWAFFLLVCAEHKSFNPNMTWNLKPVVLDCEIHLSSPVWLWRIVKIMRSQNESPVGCVTAAVLSQANDQSTAE